METQNYSVMLTPTGQQLKPFRKASQMMNQSSPQTYCCCRCLFVCFYYYYYFISFVTTECCLLVTAVPDLAIFVLMFVSLPLAVGGQGLG